MLEPKLLGLIEAVAQIALQSPLGAVRGTQVCKSLNLPARYLELELQNLVRLGILKSVRGPNGGYVLAREKRNITLADVEQGLERQKSRRRPSRFANLVIDKIAQHETALKKITIYDILQEAEERGVVDPVFKAETPKSDFAI